MSPIKSSFFVRMGRGVSEAGCVSEAKFDSEAEFLWVRFRGVNSEVSEAALFCLRFWMVNFAFVVCLCKGPSTLVTRIGAAGSLFAS